MKIYLFESESIHKNLLPLSFTRPVADFRIGILTIKEKWERYLPGDYEFYPVEYLRDVYGDVKYPGRTSLFISGNILPDEALSKEINSLSVGEALFSHDTLIAFRGKLSYLMEEKWDKKDCRCAIKKIDYVFDIFLKNFNEIRKDFRIVARGRKSAPLPRGVKIIKNDLQNARDLIFIEDGAEVDCLSINIKNGPVYIGRDSTLMEGSCLRGPLAVCEASEIRMGAKIYGGTTIGPHCKVGGEVNNIVMFGYSNKAHDGYLGNAVIGEWCNIGAGVNASNLKNDYSLIRIWNYESERFMRTTQQFCGLIMGDHSKIGVNCIINTATVMGVGVNLHGGGLPRAFIPSFSEGSSVSGFSQVDLRKFFEIAERVMARRQKQLTEGERKILEEIYEKKQG